MKRYQLNNKMSKSAAMTATPQPNYLSDTAGARITEMKVYRILDNHSDWPLPKLAHVLRQPEAEVLDYLAWARRIREERGVVTSELYTPRCASDDPTSRLRGGEVIDLPFGHKLPLTCAELLNDGELGQSFDCTWRPDYPVKEMCDRFCISEYELNLYLQHEAEFDLQYGASDFDRRSPAVSLEDAGV